MRRKTIDTTSQITGRVYRTRLPSCRSMDSGQITSSRPVKKRPGGCPLPPYTDLDSKELTGQIAARSRFQTSNSQDLENKGSSCSPTAASSHSQTFALTLTVTRTP